MLWQKTVTYQWEADSLEEAEEIWAEDGPEFGSRIGEGALVAESDIEPVTERRPDDTEIAPPERSKSAYHNPPAD